ncbi:unnamed protein product [Protopolystoma xenopodis]|uniref:Uncharacterized protein n=1 Tax=Protopolystoma xenopodis TaxID=117903 RepID=A0A3S5AWN1_9PLAT|nr:unnamed protein product [Protopolystoma xenopodis]
MAASFTVNSATDCPICLLLQRQVMTVVIGWHCGPSVCPRRLGLTSLRPPSTGWLVRPSAGNLIIFVPTSTLRHPKTFPLLLSCPHDPTSFASIPQAVAASSATDTAKLTDRNTHVQIDR